MSEQTPTPNQAKNGLPWFKKKAIVIPLGILVFIVVLNITKGPAADTSAPESSDSSNSMSTDEPTTTPEPEVTEEPEPEGPVESLSQMNARATAESYIDSAGFSRSGLIEQLEFEEYSTADATYAVDAIDVDWNEQAARTAQEYLDSSSFSRSGLYDQLIFEGYNSSQANYGLAAVGY